MIKECLTEPRLSAYRLMERRAIGTFARLNDELVRAPRDKAQSLLELMPPVAEIVRQLTLASTSFGDEAEECGGKAKEVLEHLLSQEWTSGSFRREVADLYGELLELTGPGPRFTVELLAERVRVPTPLLYYLKRRIFPSERMFVGAVYGSGSQRTVQAMYDVTGPASGAHVVADPDLLTEALLDMDASGAHFGFWAHSHPGNSPSSTHPSAEDNDSYATRVQSGDSRDMVCAVFAGNYVRFFGAGARLVELTGSGVKRVAGGEVYEFSQ